MKTFLAALLMAVTAQAQTICYNITTNSLSVLTTNSGRFVVQAWTNAGENNAYGTRVTHLSAWTTDRSTRRIPRTVYNNLGNRIPSVLSSKPVFWTENINPTNGIINACDALVGKTVLCWRNTLVATGGPCRISFRDTAMYTQGEVVTLASKDKSALRVMTVVTGVCQQVYAGASPVSLTKLPVGHYFAENSDDRCQFVVLPKNWAAAKWFGTEGMNNVVWDWPIARVFTQLNSRTWRACGYDSLSHLQTNAPAGTDPSTWFWDWAGGGQCITNHLPADNNYIAGAWMVPPYYATNATSIWPVWTNYVGALMTHYKTLADQDRLYIEVWNEPWADTWAGYSGVWGQYPFDHGPNCSNSFHCENVGTFFTNWMTAYCDMVATTEQVRASLGSKAKIYGPSTSNMDTYYDLFDMLAKRGLTNVLAAISFHDGGLNSVPPDFPDAAYNHRPGQTTLSMIQHVRELVGTNMPIFVDESEYTGRSAVTDSPHLKQQNGYYNDGEVDWRTAQNRILKHGLVFLANNVKLWIQHMLFGYPDGDLESTIELYGWEPSHGIKPKAAAILMLNYLTKDYDATSLVVTNRHVTVIFSSTTRTAAPFRVFTWAHEGEIQPIKLPADSVLYDIYGHRMSQNVLTDEVGYYDRKAKHRETQ